MAPKDGGASKRPAVTLLKTRQPKFMKIRTSRRRRAGVGHPSAKRRLRVWRPKDSEKDVNAPARLAEPSRQRDGF